MHSPARPLLPRRAVPALLVAAALAITAVGCAPPPRPVEAPGPAPAAGVGLSGAIMQYRSEIAVRTVTVRVRATEPLDVRALTVHPAGFEPGERTAADARLDAGTSVDLKAGYGPARCDAAPAGGSEAVLEVARDGGTEEVVLALEDSYDAIGALRRAECAEQELRNQVEFGFTGGWRPDRDGAVLRTTLSLQRLGGASEIVVTELDGNTLFAVRAGPTGGPVAVLPPDADEVTVPFEVETSRCESHALVESKRATSFALFVTADADAGTRIVVEPDDTGRAQLLEYATTSCAAKGLTG